MRRGGDSRDKPWCEWNHLMNSLRESVKSLPLCFLIGARFRLKAWSGGRFARCFEKESLGSPLVTERFSCFEMLKDLASRTLLPYLGSALRMLGFGCTARG